MIEGDAPWILLSWFSSHQACRIVGPASRGKDMSQGPWDNSHDWTVAYVNRFIETNNQPKFSLVRISLMFHAGLDMYKSFLPILLGSQAEESDGRLQESAVKRASFPRARRSGGAVSYTHLTLPTNREV